MNTVLTVAKSEVDARNMHKIVRKKKIFDEKLVYVVEMCYFCMHI